MSRSPVGRPDFPGTGGGEQPDTDPGGESPDGESPGGGTMDENEQRVRRALGLMSGSRPAARNWSGGSQRGDTAQRTRADAQHRSTGSGSSQKSRFVQDGDVPVVLMNSRNGHAADAPAAGAAPERARLAEAEAALRRERAAREQAERALHQAQATIHDLQTRLGHAELARDEALAAAERAAAERLAAERADAERAEAEGALLAQAAQAEPEVEAEPDQYYGLLERGRAGADTSRSAPVLRVKASRRPRTTPPPQLPPPDPQQPVKWWLPRDVRDSAPDTDED